MTNKKSNILPIVVMYLLFFMIAFVTNLCNPMAVIVKNNFAMSNFAAQLGNAANFIAYAAMGIPAGMLLKKNTPIPYALHCFIDDFRKEN